MQIIFIMSGYKEGQTNPKRGGKRAGAGRMRKESKKIRISTSLAPDVVAYLNSRTDKPKAQIIEEALRDHKENHEN